MVLLVSTEALALKVFKVFKVQLALPVQMVQVVLQV
jgi:hypothetical protein